MSSYRILSAPRGRRKTLVDFNGVKTDLLFKSPLKDSISNYLCGCERSDGSPIYIKIKEETEGEFSLISKIDSPIHECNLRVFNSNSLISGQYLAPIITSFIENVWDEIKDSQTTNRPAQYIEFLSNRPTDVFGAAMVDKFGLFQNFGNSEELVTLQSVVKIFTFAFALGECYDEMQAKVAACFTELPFNEFGLNKEGKAYNCCYNPGALAVVGILINKFGHRTYDKVLSYIEISCGLAENSLHHNRQCYQDELSDSKNNLRLILQLQVHGVIDRTLDENALLRIYTKLCSVEVNCQQAVKFAQILLNEGYVSGMQKMNSTIVQMVRQQMLVAGLYGVSMRAFTEYGLIGKSGVGGLCLILLKDMALVVNSPVLDDDFTSEKAMLLVKRMISEFPALKLQI